MRSHLTFWSLSERFCLLQPEDQLPAILGAAAGPALLPAVQHGLQREVPLQAPLKQGRELLLPKKWLFFLRGLKGPCHTIKVTKNVIWYFQKLRVHIVVDYADTCWNSRWLRGHNVSVATDYADTMSISCWLCGQGVGEVVDYADTIMTMQTLSEKIWRLLTDFKGTIRQKRYENVLHIQEQ